MSHVACSVRRNVCRLQLLFRLFDPEGTGTVNAERFVLSLGLITAPTTQTEQVGLLFRMYDQNNEGLSRDSSICRRVVPSHHYIIPGCRYYRAADTRGVQSDDCDDDQHVRAPLFTPLLSIVCTPLSGRYIRVAHA